MSYIEKYQLTFALYWSTVRNNHVKIKKYITEPENLYLKAELAPDFKESQQILIVYRRANPKIILQ